MPLPLRSYSSEEEEEKNLSRPATAVVDGHPQPVVTAARRSKQELPDRAASSCGILGVP
jgi:hypothetical protein